MKKSEKSIKESQIREVDEFHIYLPADVGSRVRKFATTDKRKLNNAILLLILVGLQKRGY